VSHAEFWKITKEGTLRRKSAGEGFHQNNIFEQGYKGD